MTQLRRLMGTLALAGLLASGIATSATPAAAAGVVVGSNHFTRASACTHLSDYINRLQALPAGPLRDALLKFALALQAKYCG
jgi:hypothetical protein